MNDRHTKPFIFGSIPTSVFPNAVVIELKPGNFSSHNWLGMLDDIFNALIKITAEQDMDTLQKGFLEILSDFFSTTYAGIYMPVESQGELLVKESLSLNIRGNRGEEHWFSGYELQKPQPQLEDCILERLQIEVDSDVPSQTTLYLPVVFAGKTHSVIKLHTNLACKVKRAILDQVLLLYTNYAHLLHVSTHDSLTGLLNRKTFESRFLNLAQERFRVQKCLAEQYDKEEKRKASNSKRLCLAIVDIDHFKRINDNYGHIYGDEILLMVSQLMQKSFRSNDLLFRYGGEEFLILMEPTFEGDIHHVLNRYRENVENYRFPQVGEVTVSIGYTTISGLDHCSSYIGRADQALYYAKENGRNSIFSHEMLLATGALKQSSSNDEIDWF